MIAAPLSLAPSAGVLAPLLAPLSGISGSPANSPVRSPSGYLLAPCFLSPPYPQASRRGLRAPTGLMQWLPEKRSIPLASMFAEPGSPVGALTLLRR